MKFFESFNKLPEDAKDALKGVARTVGMTAAGVGAGLAANAAEQPTSQDYNTPEDAVHAQAEVQNSDATETATSLDFLEAEQEIKKQELEHLMQEYERFEIALGKAQERLEGFEQSFMEALVQVGDYIQEHDSREYKQAQKALGQFNPQVFLQDLQKNLSKFTYYYAQQGASFEEIKSGEIALAMRMGAIETGNENAAFLHEAIQDKNIGDVITSSADKTRRDILQNPAIEMIPLVVDLVKAQKDFTEAQNKLNTFQAENALFASQ